MASYRLELDRTANWAVPAHVTVPYPFIPPDRIHAGTLDAVTAALAAVPAFVCTFATVQWHGRDIAWLAPDPDTGFHALTEAVRARFPDYPPHGGACQDTIPHPTIGHRPTAEGDHLQQATQQVQAAPPAHTSADPLLPIAGTDAPQSWHTSPSSPRTPNPEP